MARVADIDCKNALPSIADKASIGRSPIGVPFGDGHRYDRILEYQVVWKHRHGKNLHLSFSNPTHARTTAAIIDRIETVEYVYFLALVEQDWYYWPDAEGAFVIGGIKHKKVFKKRIAHWRPPWLVNLEPIIESKPQLHHIKVESQQSLPGKVHLCVSP
jgi:hypothetical protein